MVITIYLNTVMPEFTIATVYGRPMYATYSRVCNKYVAAQPRESRAKFFVGV